MPLSLADDPRQAVESLDPDLAAAARAIGVSMASELGRLRPALARVADGEAEPDAVVEDLELDREGPPDPVTLAACLAAHRAYVAARSRPEAVSVGALAISRLLAWAARAAVLGPAPKLVWIGPPARAPEPAEGQLRLGARCAVRVGDARREAHAVALVAPPA